MATPPPSPALAGEIGYAGKTPTGFWQYGDQDESTPEVAWPACIDVYDRMRRQDSQIASVLAAITLPIRSTTWRIDPAGARDEVVELVAGDLGLPVKGTTEDAPSRRGRGRFDWAEHLRLALLMLPHGHMAFEQVYRLDETGARPMTHLRKLGPRFPHSIERFNVAADGGLVSITQKPVMVGNDTITPTIPVDRLVMYVRDREGSAWWGQSILRPAYKDWVLKDRRLMVAMLAAERNGLGIAVYEGAEGETDLNAGQKLATAVRAGERAGAATPYGAKLRLAGVEGTVPEMLPWVRYHDESMARAVLAHFLNLGQAAGTGSWALGTTLGDFFTQSLQGIAHQIATTATQHVVEDLVDLNWGEDEPAPRVVFDEIGSRTASVAIALQMLVQAGVIQPDADLEAYIRTGLGLPPADDTTRNEPQQPDQTEAPS